MPRVVIVGAGISGLALAHELAKRGAEPIVLESDSRAGGKIRSSRTDGFLCESGPASFLVRDASVATLVREVGLEPRLVEASPAAKRRCVAHEGKLEPVPTSPGAFLRTPLLPFASKLRVLADVVLPRGPAGRGEEESVASFARRRLGARAAERLFYPLVSGIYAGDAERLSLPDAFPFLAELERDHRSLIVGAARRSAKPSPLVSFPDGVEELTSALARELGERLHVGASVRAVEQWRDGFRIVIEEHGSSEVIEAGAVVLAVPAHAAAPVVRHLDPDVGRALSDIPYAPVTLVNLGFAARKLPRPLNAYGFLVPPSEPSRLLGAVFASSVFAARAPEGRVLVSTRIGGLREPALAQASATELYGLVRTELDRYLGITARPSFVEMVRHERALPQYTLGHSKRLEAIGAAEARHPGLFFTGNAYRGLGIPDCIRNAGPLAERVANFVARARERVDEPTRSR